VHVSHWNALLDYVVKAESVDAFKNTMDKELGTIVPYELFARLSYRATYLLHSGVGVAL